MRALHAIMTLAAVAVPFGGSSCLAQHFSSARGMALGAYTAAVADAGAIDWNPAGLTRLRDWDLSAANYLQLRSGGSGITLHHAAAGKRFLPDHSAALRYSPGIRLEFIVPSTFTIEDSNSTILTQFDKEISYTEQFALGYAFRAGERISLGFSAHFLEEKVTDTEYDIDTGNVITASPVQYAGKSWTVDWGAMWDPLPGLTLGAVAKNLFRITESALPASADVPPLELPKTLRAGAAYAGVRNLLFSADAGTDRRIGAGAEWSASEFLTVRAGAYLDADGRFTAEAFGAGVSSSIGNVDLGVALLLFTDQTGRRGSADLSGFRQSGVEGIEYNHFTGDRASFTVALNLGRTRDPIARIEYVEMLSDIYPSSPAVHAFRPVGRARVKNVTDSPIEATVSFRLDRYMDAPTESRPQTIQAGESVEVPFFAVLNSAVQGIRTMIVGEGEVSVSAVRRGESEDSYQAKVLLRGKNDWNGDVTLLRYFITPDDPEILATTRSLLAAGGAALDTTDALLRDFRRAQTLFDALSGRLLYVRDPRGSQDHVQYPSETLSLRGGDCDDLSVLFCSMLSSIGIRTAFVDVVPPDRPDSGHIYVMFDTGIPPEGAGVLTDNPKRYVVRRGAGGAPTLWVPLETTLTRKGFAVAWEDGANQYYDDVEVGHGLARGWVRIVDHETDF